MKLSIVLSTQPAKFQAATLKGDLDNNMARIAAMGYEGVELAIRDPSLVDFADIQYLLQKYSLEVPAIGTGQAWGEEGLSFTDPDAHIRQAAIDRIQSHFPGAARLGATVIIGLIRGIVRPGVAHDQAMAWLVSALKECSQAAQAHAVRLALEPINRYETSLINNAAQGLELVHSVGASNFGLLLDTFHMNLEEANIEESIRHCKSRVFHFHVADSNRWYPGGGHLSFESILCSLRDTGYDGWVSGEFLPHPDPHTAAALGLSHLRKIQGRL